MALRDYATGSPIPLSGGPAGGAENGLPRYLLLYGGPDVLPWWLQYVLNAGNFVGRLHLEGEGLENYVSALLDGWRDSRSRYDRPVVWAPDFGGADMTAVMHRTLATPLADKLRADPDGDMAGIVTLESDAATAAGLRDVLVASTPSLVVTTSHGQTAPLANPVALRRDVGKLVDQERFLVEPGDLLAKWQPDGAYVASGTPMPAAPQEPTRQARSPSSSPRAPGCGSSSRACPPSRRSWHRFPRLCRAL